MADRLELTLCITLDHQTLERHLHRPVDKDTAFFVFGLVHAMLADRLGEGSTNVRIESATGYSAAFLASMNGFAHRHKRALDALDAFGEAVVDDLDVVEVFEQLHDVVITPVGSKWRVTRVERPRAM